MEINQDMAKHTFGITKRLYGAPTESGIPKFARAINWRTTLEVCIARDNQKVLIDKF